MPNICGKPIFPLRGFIPIGHCGLIEYHDGKCMMQIETKSDAMQTKQLDIDLRDLWKPIRDLPDGHTPCFPFAYET
ncbi:MAG: hypothetical protein A2845_04345 [Candidatus Lloydbacteria bacterium RIFCSPHIGHO2_01_FULL_49_22]|uniref:Uncharacterized protein n=1 Tax=Candidatus Lloydbacteria bacterium RIFCSPHIGHO2_01_FULL_49_22 TaxID=1798658 RepID=A0A1G2CUK0_9BACT|nr:MAG: hypothetical protein A2845_04345 [Candidatus Lloydbacteria bacterium RIFCSPHIGHO2_01_FULL_49_22]OGZ08882.1 MAG: hypothetical protein A3C14_01380 [Candidatus Lloydbacteria bacterium RIFCSPHIGHO2_02_FULL_50_18]